ncbi:MAG: sugar kinase [Chloroflexota bacterium]
MPDVVTLGETMALFSPRDAGPLRYVTEFRLRFGGAETNFAIALARLGISVGWISRLGHDEFGRLIAHHLRGEGVDTSRVITDRERSTAIYVKERRAAGDPSVYYYRRSSAASALCPDDIEESYVAGARWLHITGITPALSPSCHAAVTRAIDIARANGARVSMDPNLRLKLWSIEQARETLLPMFRRCHVLLGGDSELELLLQTRSPEQSAAWALDAGLEVAVVKLGSAGALVATAGRSATAPPFPVEVVVDSIGAGDGFDAGFVHGMLGGRDPWEAARIGNAVAVHALQVDGDYEGFPTRSELDAFMQGQETVKR